MVNPLVSVQATTNGTTGWQDIPAGLDLPDPANGSQYIGKLCRRKGDHVQGAISRTLLVNWIGGTPQPLADVRNDIEVRV